MRVIAHVLWRGHEITVRSILFLSVQIVGHEMAPVWVLRNTCRHIMDSEQATPSQQDPSFPALRPARTDA